MFNIGDKIVYPNQGIGIIDIIEEKEFKGEKENYYIIHLFSNTMKLILPFSRVEPSNIRLISDSNTLDNSLNQISRFFEDAGEFLKVDFKERKAIAEEKIKSGALDDYLEIICKLTKLKNQHNLNSSEKQILRTATKLVIEEISQAKNVSNDEAANLLDECMIAEN